MAGPKIEIRATPTSLQPGDALRVDVDNADEEPQKSGTIKVKYGNIVIAQWSGTLPRGSYYTQESQPFPHQVYRSSGRLTQTFACTREWFTTANVATQKQFTVLVEASFGNDTVSVTGITVNSTKDMGPTAGSATATAVNSAQVEAAFPGQIIAGVSRVKIAATVVAGSNAAISTVYMKASGMSDVRMYYNSSSGKYEGTTITPISATTTYTIEATDQRGYTGTHQIIVSAIPYVKPSSMIDLVDTYRCTQTGTRTAGGLYVKVKATAIYDSTNLSGNQLLKFGFYIQEDGASYFTNLTSGTQSSPVQIRSRQESDAVTVVVVIQDKISGEVTRTMRLPGSGRNIVLKRTSGGTFLGIGKAPATTGGEYGFTSGVELPEGGAFMVEGVPFDAATQLYKLDATGFGQNMLNVNFSHRYAAENMTSYFTKTAYASGWSNIPSSIASSATWSGVRFVVLAGSLAFIIVIEVTPNAGRIWYQWKTSGGSTSGWVYIASSQA